MFPNSSRAVIYIKKGLPVRGLAVASYMWRGQCNKPIYTNICADGNIATIYDNILLVVQQYSGLRM